MARTNRNQARDPRAWRGADMANRKSLESKRNRGFVAGIATPVLSGPSKDQSSIALSILRQGTEAAEPIVG